MNLIAQIPAPENEPVKDYRPGSSERASIEQWLEKAHQERAQISLYIDGEKICTEHQLPVTCPYDHQRELGAASSATEAHAEQAIQAALAAQASWGSLPWQERVAVFLRAAELAAGPWRDRLNGTTMLGQGKTIYQAEIDSACELVDFLRFNCAFAEQIYGSQPKSGKGVWNQLEYRPLEGFVFAITPFNFTAIAGNLAAAPAIMGNTVVWKPSERSLLSSQVVMELMIEAGLPKGVINFLPTDNPVAIGDRILRDEHLSGVHFTGSTPTFEAIWKRVADNLATYRSYPRVVGETGGKDFVLADPSADPAAVVTALVRGAFEFQGQKCSAASRAYIPDSLWDDVTTHLKREVESIAMGSPEDLQNFMGPVIDDRAFRDIAGFIELARSSDDYEILIGGGCDDEEGYFVSPTVVVSKDPTSRLMTEEIFGPVLTIYRYADKDIDEVLESINTATRYALTGAIFARDRLVVSRAAERLRHSAGNFYINDKPTGAVVGQQPFGGGRKSGTNDKAGSVLNLLRWTSPRTIKETFDSPTEYQYPFMQSG